MIDETANQPPAYSEKLQRVRDAAAKLLQIARDEEFYVVGVVYNKNGEVLQIRNTSDDFVSLMKAATSMVEQLQKRGVRPIIHDSVTRQN